MKRLLCVMMLGSTIAGTNTFHKDFFRNYRVDPEIKQILDEHADSIAHCLKKVDDGRQKYGVWQFEWLPDYYIKYGLARIFGMEKMKQAIDRCNLSFITLPDKRLYKLPGSSKKPSNRNCAIVVKRIEAQDNPAPITLDEIQQLCILMHETGYISMFGPLAVKGPNYIRTTDNRFCIIDTESSYAPNHLLEGFLRILESHDFTTDLSQEALKHILWEIEQQVKKRPQTPDQTIKRIIACLENQQGEPSWQYKTYIKSFCTHLAHQREAVSSSM